MNFKAFVNEIKENNWKVHGVEVYKADALVEQYGDTAGKYPIYSATKSILSIAIGIAENRGLIDLSNSLLCYMPKPVLEGLSKEQKDAYAHITLHRLMTMSVEGYPFRPEGESFLKDSFRYTIPEPEKAAFQYSNIPAYLAGVALSNAIDGDAWAFIEENILLPLGIEGAEYTRCPDGYFYGASGMKVSVHDLSKIGLLLYHGGEFQGKRIVSEDYVRRATSVLQMNREGGYGYFIWNYGDGFSISGKWKQKCFVLPKEKMMVTFLSDIPEADCDVVGSMERNLLL